MCHNTRGVAWRGQDGLWSVDLQCIAKKPMAEVRFRLEQAVAPGELHGSLDGQVDLDVQAREEVSDAS